MPTLRAFRARWWPIVAVLLGAFALRVHGLDRSALSGDEAYTVWLAVQGPTAIVAATRTGEPHPPLFYLLVWAWQSVAGISEFALRYPTVLFGVLGVALTCRLGLALRGPTTAMLAACFMATQPYVVWYAQESRMYVPLAAFSAAALLSFLLFWRRGRWPAAVATVGCNVLAIFCHYYGLFLIPIQAAYLALNGPGAASWRTWIALSATALGLYLPWPVVAWQVVGSYNALGPTPLAVALHDLVVWYTVGPFFADGGALPVALGVMALALLGLVASGSRRQGDDRGLMAVAVLVPAALVPLLSLWRPMFAARYFMVGAPAFALCVATGVSLLWRWRPVGALATAALLGVLALGLWPLFWGAAGVKSGYRELVQFLHERAGPGEAVVLAGHSQQFQFWYEYRTRRAGALPSFVLPEEGSLATARTARRVQNLLEQFDGLWLIDTDTLRYDPERVIEGALLRHGYRVLDGKTFLHNRLVYARSAPDPPSTGTSVDLGPVRLVDVRIAPQPVRPGQVVPLALDWTATAELVPRLKVSLRLVNPDGVVVQAVDGEPVGGFAPTSTWSVGQVVRDRYGFVVPPTVPPGTYHFHVVVYEAETGREVGGSDGRPLAHLEISGAPLDELKTGSARPVVATFDGLRLHGWDAPIAPVRSGTPFSSVLYWEVERVGGVGPFSLRWIDETGHERAAQPVTLAPAWSPVDRWPKGYTVAVPLRVVVPPRLASGRYVVHLASGQAGAPPAVAAPLGAVVVEAPSRSFAAPRPGVAVDEVVGGFARLVGFDVQEEAGVLRPGGRLSVTLHWEAVAETDESYKVTLQLLGPDGQLHGQRDFWPGEGARPTTSWVKGEFLSDTVAVPLEADAPFGSYRLLLGLYDERSGQRLRTADGEDHLVLTVLEVVGSS